MMAEMALGFPGTMGASVPLLLVLQIPEEMANVTERFHPHIRWWLRSGERPLAHIDYPCTK